MGKSLPRVPNMSVHYKYSLRRNTFVFLITSLVVSLAESAMHRFRHNNLSVVDHLHTFVEKIEHERHTLCTGRVNCLSQMINEADVLNQHRQIISKPFLDSFLRFTLPFSLIRWTNTSKQFTGTLFSLCLC